MDEQRFDALARALGDGGSRRRLVGGLLGGLAGALALESPSLARKHRQHADAKQHRRRKQGGDASADPAGDGTDAQDAPAADAGQAKGGHGKGGKSQPASSDLSPEKKKKKKCKGGKTKCGKACVDLQTDTANCGTCGNACPDGVTCQVGVCGDAPCDGCWDGERCQSGTSDGACGPSGYNCEVCDGGRSCVDHQCQCPSDKTDCFGVCADLQNDHAYCGSCINDCDNDHTCCSGQCQRLDNDPNNCGACGNACNSRRADTCADGACKCGNGDPCGANETCCSGTCVATDSDPSQCGACGHACDPTVADTCTGGTCTCGGVAPCDGVTGTCQSGACSCGSRSACPSGRLCCSDSCVNPNTDSGNCGACGHVCDTAKADRCVGGTCQCGSGAACGSGFRCCGGTCIDTSSDMANCGGCGKACAPGGSHCISGFCKCSDNVNGLGACASPLTCCMNGSGNGICKNLQNDYANCGACFNVCSSQSCVGGVCGCGQQTCANGFSCCTDSHTGSSTCRNLQSDFTTCGNCGTACDARFADTCAGGTCKCGSGAACTNGTRCCGGTCVNISSDVNNCSSCGNVCPGATSGTANATCSTGSCTFSCIGPNYDVNDTMADGCEYYLPVANYTEAFAIDLAPGHGFSCNDGNVGSFRTTLASDARSHVPPFDGFNATVGGVPQWFKMGTTGGACANDFAVTMSSANATTGCYKITLMDGNRSFAALGSCTPATSTQSNTTCSFSGGSGSYATGDVLYLKIEKTCTTAVATEAATFDVRFHL